MTNEEFLRELAIALTRLEDLSYAEAEDVLYELALRIYALLLAKLPDSRFDRYWEWPQLRRELEPWLQRASLALGELTFTRLIAAEETVVRLVRELFGYPPEALGPRSAERVLDETRVLEMPVSMMFAAEPRTGLTSFALQLLRLLERQLLAGLVAEAPREEVARKVVEMRTVSGRRQPRITKGTVANAWRERYRAVLSGALWGLVTPALKRGDGIQESLGRGAVPLWVWNAILDPRTCPVCRPLHKTTALSPDLFPLGAPPLHPQCRCVVLPLGR